MFAYQAGAFCGSYAYAATSPRGRAIVISVSTSTSNNEKEYRFGDERSGETDGSFRPFGQVTSMTLAAGLLLAGLSAAVSQVGFLLPHRGAVAAPDVDMHHPLRSATGLFRSKWWTVGYALA
jgi:hypothetical protein